MAKILIAGGTGLIGKETTSLLQEANHEVIFLSRRANPDAAVPTYKWDIKEKYIDPQALVDVDYVVNLAGAGIADKRWSDQRKQLIIQSRVEGNMLFKHYIESGQLKPKKFISGAAIGIYGNRGSEVLTEQSVPRNDGFLAESCIRWEESILALESTGVPLAYVRIGIVLSTEGGALEKMLLPAKLGLGSYFGDGAQIYSWIHIRDIARILQWLINEPSATGVYNGTAPNPVSNKAFMQSLIKVKNGPGIIAPVPTFALSLMLGEMKQVVLWGSHVLPARLSNANFNFDFDQVEDALRNLVG
jgi:uncharacterized protein (TIGR01777 family)